MKSLLSKNPSDRPRINSLKNNNWITKNSEYPLPCVYTEAISYYNEKMLRDSIKKKNSIES